MPGGATNGSGAARLRRFVVEHLDDRKMVVRAILLALFERRIGSDEFPPFARYLFTATDIRGFFEHLLAYFLVTRRTEIDDAWIGAAPRIRPLYPAMANWLKTLFIDDRPAGPAADRQHLGHGVHRHAVGRRRVPIAQHPGLRACGAGVGHARPPRPRAARARANLAARLRVHPPHRARGVCRGPAAASGDRPDGRQADPDRRRRAGQPVPGIGVSGPADRGQAGRRPVSRGDQHPETLPDG